MTGAAWSAIDRLLSDALDRPEAERQAYVRAACGGDGRLEAEVLSLLEQAGRAGPLDALDADGFADNSAALAGRRVGPYRLIREIGRGGMGSVWLAERDDGQFLKRVAVKLLAAGLPVREALRRFKDERQILASLEHPQIARLLDAGSSDDGLHYIVMEFVEGVPITEHCRARALDTRARVDLLRAIASTVHFAHQRLVVHRDLKPANILVTSSGEPRLLDFGIAKILAPESAAATAPLLHLATPAYASPEQLRGLPVTTSTDVYSLGILCCELLAGGLPDRTSDRAEPPSAVAVRVGVTPSLARETAAQLAGDLDAIVSKATEVLPADRYASAEEFAADLGRYLTWQPVLARGGTLRYRLQKLAARHRAGAIAAAFALLAAVVGVTGIVWQARVAQRERRLADARFNDVRQLAGAMIFDLYDRIAELPGSTTARQALVTKALQYLGSLSREAGDDPALGLELASAYLRVADVQFSATGYANLGDTAGALASLTESRRILDGRLARAPRDVQAQRLLARAHLSTAGVHLYLRNQKEARASVERGVALRERLGASGDDVDRRELADAYFRLADVVASDDPEASLIPRRRALGMFEAMLASRPGDEALRRSVARASKTLGSSLNDLHRYDEAETHYARALAIDESRVNAAPNSALAQLDLSLDLSLLATLKMNRDDNRGAWPYWERTIAIRLALVSADPKDARAKGRLAYAYLRSSSVRERLADFDGGLADARASLALAEALLEVNPDDAIARSYATQAWQRIAYNEMGLEGRAAAGERALHRSRACTAYGQALDSYRRIAGAGRTDAVDRANADIMESRLRGCVPPAVARREPPSP